MISLRSKAQDRGHFNHGGSTPTRTFFFADYHDPGQLGLSVLRVSGNGAHISDATEIHLTGQQRTEALLFDLP
jgi:hypothetical protein